MATFEKFILDYLDKELGGVEMVITPNNIAVSMSDNEQLSSYHAEAMFLVDCVYSTKMQADGILELVNKAMRELPTKKPIVLRTSRIAQNIDTEGAPRRWRYTGVYQIRYHIEDSY